ncbi:unnamed protein product [Arctogadus glacialis]
MSEYDDKGDWKDKEVPKSRLPAVPEVLQEDAESAGKKLCKTAEEQEAEEPEEGLASMCRSHKLWDGYKEDRAFTGEPLAPDGSKVRNEAELGWSESDEDMGYFQKGPQDESWMNTQGDFLPEEERESANERGAESDESMYKDKEKEEKKANFLTMLSPREDGGPCGDEDILNFPIRDLVQSLGELVSGEDTVEGSTEKGKEFTGGDHQRAGETFAVFPPDISSWGKDEAADEESKGNLDAVLSASSETSHLDRETEPTLLGTGNIDNKEDRDLGPGWTETVVEAKCRAFTAGATDDKCKSKTLPYAQRTVLPCWSNVGEEIGTCPENADHTQDEAELIGATNTCSPSDKDLHPFYDHTCATKSIFDIRPPIIHIISNSDDIQANKTDGECKRDDLSQHESAPALSPPPLQKHHVEMRTVSEDSSLTKIDTTWESPTGGEDNMWAKMPGFSQESMLNTEDRGKQNSQSSLETAEPTKVASKDPFNTDVQGDIRPSTLLSNQGSVDDGFFFTHEDEASGIAELGYDGDEYEDSRNWEDEQERIQAFYKFYNESDGEMDQEGRKTKVHFCMDLLPQVFHYDSEADLLDSSTEAEEEMIPEYNGKRENDTSTLNSNLQLNRDVVPETGLGLLKSILKMFLVMGTGLLVFWWTMDETDFLGLPLFKG